jgi:hypothetical protein
MLQLILDQRDASKMYGGIHSVHIADYVKPNFAVTTTLPSQMIGHQSINLT